MHSTSKGFDELAHVWMLTRSEKETGGLGRKEAFACGEGDKATELTFMLSSWVPPSIEYETLETERLEQHLVEP